MPGGPSLCKPSVDAGNPHLRQAVKKLPPSWASSTIGAVSVTWRINYALFLDVTA